MQGTVEKGPILDLRGGVITNVKQSGCVPPYQQLFIGDEGLLLNVCLWHSICDPFLRQSLMLHTCACGAGEVNKVLWKDEGIVCNLPPGLPGICARALITRRLLGAGLQVHHRRSACGTRLLWLCCL